MIAFCGLGGKKAERELVRVVNAGNGGEVWLILNQRLR
jgi:hypothetical protein